MEDVQLRVTWREQRFLTIRSEKSVDESEFISISFQKRVSFRLFLYLISLQLAELPVHVRALNLKDDAECKAHMAAIVHLFKHSLISSSLLCLHPSDDDYIPSKEFVAAGGLERIVLFLNDKTEQPLLQDALQILVQFSTGSVEYVDRFAQVPNGIVSLVHLIAVCLYVFLFSSMDTCCLSLRREIHVL